MTNVSIVVPVFNGEETIEKCLKSLLDLNYPKNKLEIIVVDNNSQDKTPKIVRKFPVRFLFESIQSSFAARNKGIKNAKYEIIAFTDADCVAHKNWVKELIKKFKDSEVMGVSGKILAYEKKTLTQKFTDDIIRKIWDTRTGLKWFEGANVAYRKKVFLKEGYFRNVLSSSDVAFSRKLKNKGYKLVFAKKAIIYHIDRKKVTELIKQFYKYGQGRLSYDKEKIFIEILKLSGSVFFSLLQIVPSFLINRNEKKFYPILKVFMITSFFMGILKEYMRILYSFLINL